VRKKAKNKISFRFYGAGGSASGPIAPWLFAGLIALAILAIVFLATKVGGALFASTWVARIRGP
jgi:hypothetical protein